MSGDDLSRAGQLIGRQAEFDSSVAGLSPAAPAEWRWSMPRTPATLEAEILDSSGRVVARPTLAGTASGSLTWDGSLTGGGRAADGAYGLKLIARDSARTAIAPDLTSIGRVQEAVAREGATWPGVGGVALPLDKLVRIAA